MSRKKKIALITMCPEYEYNQKIFSGVFSQCLKYNYDVLVFTPMVHSSHTFKDYLKGEVNIYNMINFDMVDGVILVPVPMTENRDPAVLNQVVEKLKKDCKKPVVAIDLNVCDYPTKVTDTTSSFFHITNHLIKVHNCTSIMMLAGQEGYSVSDLRIAGYKKAMEENGLNFSQKNVVYGDFWYTSGEQLAEGILSGKVEKPQAVVCASDHMAIGLTNALIKGGVKVPEEVIVTGYEAISEAVLNTPPITSYEAYHQGAAAKAVNYLREILDPEKIVYVPGSASEKNLCIGKTCGCVPDEKYIYTKIKGSQYTFDHNFSDNSVWNGIDIGMLLESYMAEILTATSTVYQCLGKIYENIYLLKPYLNFFLCLNEDWLDSYADREEGYAENMKLVIFSDMEKKLHGYENHVFFGKGREKIFNTKEMLPALADDEFDTAQVFYFIPVHFNIISLGYAVLQNDMRTPGEIGTVLKNFIRNINNGLEMARARNRITDISERDMMTGLYNRRGMERNVQEMNSTAGPKDKWFAAVIDMDGLKLRNDTYGHTEGDAGIMAIAKAALKICKGNEICVRSGGDEFYILGLGHYTEKECQKRYEEFKAELFELNKNLNLPVSASFGYAIEKNTGETAYEKALGNADVQMYLEKRSKKRH